MIKATIKSFKGAEFKVNQNVFVWIGFACADGKEFIISTCLQKTREDSRLKKLNHTEKELIPLIRIPEKFTIKISEVREFTGFEDQLVAIQEKVISMIQNEVHIATLEIV